MNLVPKGKKKSMSDLSKTARCSNIFRGSEIRRPQDPHQSQRMGHWKHSSSNFAPDIHRNPTDNEDTHKEECARRRQSLLPQPWKSRETDIGNGQMSHHGASPVMSDALRSVEGMIAGKGAINITGDCRRKENTRAFEAERMILSKTSVCRMESSRVDWKNVDSSPFLHSGIVSSEWQRFAEFNVNQKTQRVLQSKRKYGCWDARLDRQLQTSQSEFASAPGEVKSMPEEFQFHRKYVVQRRRFYRFFEKKRLPSCRPLQNGCMRSASVYELDGLSQTPDAGPSISTREENIHSVSGIVCKEKLANRSCWNLENQICEPYKHSLLTFSEKQRDEKLSMGRSWPKPRDQSPKARGDSPVDVSGSELLLIKRSSMQGFMELNESFCKQHFQQSLPGLSMQELRRCTTVDSVGRPLRISISDEKVGGQSVDAYSTDVRNESHVRTACLDTDARRVKSLPEGVTSTRSDKEDFTGMQNPKKSELTSALQMKEAIISNQETELLDTSLNFSPCIGTADSMDPKGLSMSRMDAMEVEHIIPQVEKAEKFDSGHQLENHLGTEVSSRWVKRLKVNSDSVATDTRDYNKEDVLTTRRVHKLLSRVMNYSRSNSFTLAGCLQECQQFQKTMLLLRNHDSPVESLKESHPWVQRWCQKSEETARPKTRKPIEVLCEPEMTKPLPENLEGQLFPSLAAMALMGKAINNFRPCEFRRRGSSFVWNTEGFQRPEYSSTWR